MLDVWFLNHVTLFTANDSVLARLLMPGKVPLEHFSLTAEVGASERGVLALGLVLVKLTVGKHLRAALFGILTGRTNRAELSLKERVGIHQFERGRAAIGAADLVVSSNHLVNVFVDALLAESFAALVTLTRIEHHILTQGAVEQSVVFLFLNLRTFSRGCCASLDLRASQGRSALQDHWNCVLAVTGC